MGYSANINNIIFEDISRELCKQYQDMLNEADKERDQIKKQTLLQRANDIVTNLINSNDHFIFSICKRYTIKEEFDDSYQICMLAFIRAAKTFDVQGETKFSTYSAKCMINDIRLLEKSNRFTRFEMKYNRALKDLMDMGINDPTHAEIAKQMNLSYFDYASLYNMRNSISTDDVISDSKKVESSDTTFVEIIPDGSINVEETGILNGEVDNVRKVMENRLRDREYSYIWEHYILGKTQAQIADDNKVSRQYVNLVISRGLKKLKKYFQLKQRLEDNKQQENLQ